MEFPALKHKSVSADFSAGTLSSDAGLLLLRAADQRLGLLERIAGCIRDTRNQDLIEHEVVTMLRQRIFGIACGYEDLNDQQQLRKDALVKLAANILPGGNDLASAPTLCRLERRVRRQDLVLMSKELVEIFIASFRKAPKQLILDFDTTDIALHGNQEGRFFHGYYDHYCYLPLYVFCQGRVLVTYLRAANIDGARHAWAILKLLVKRLRQQWPHVRIIMRGDSGFCRDRMLRWCERQGVYYIVGIGTNKRLATAAATIIEASRQRHVQSGQKVRLFGEISYGALSWGCQRRVIVKAEQLAQGENIRYVVTNLPDADAQRLYDVRYVQRGEMENRIKEQQLDLFAGRTSCRRFLSNQFRLLLASLAYVLIEHIRRVGLKGSSLAHAYCGTLRLKLLKVGALVVEKSRRIMVHLSRCYVYRDMFRLIAWRLSG